MNCVEIVTVWVENRPHSTAKVLSISPAAGKKKLIDSVASHSQRDAWFTFDLTAGGSVVIFHKFYYKIRQHIE